MKTKIRLLTVVFSLVMLGAFASVPAVTYLKVAKEDFLEINIATMASLVMLLLFLGGLTAIIKLVKVIIINEEIRKVTIRHPFLLQSKEYSFDEISGFRWSYLSGRVRYKSIKLRTADSRVYQFSDFEVGNLRGIETLIYKNFELKLGKAWLSPSEKQKQFELQRSRAFDIEQAEDINWYLWSAIIMLTILFTILLYKFYENGLSIKVGEIVFLTIILIS
ncbi:hypothetical protein FVR03_24130, partial [Pontibacter qinzhouensis]